MCVIYNYVSAGCMCTNVYPVCSQICTRVMCKHAYLQAEHQCASSRFPGIHTCVMCKHACLQAVCSRTYPHMFPGMWYVHRQVCRLCAHGCSLVCSQVCGVCAGWSTGCVHKHVSSHVPRYVLCAQAGLQAVCTQMKPRVFPSV